MVPRVGRVRRPPSRREMTLFVVDILAATSSCVMPAAIRAATRSATSACNVRSAASVRERLFPRRPFASAARLFARTRECSYTAVVVLARAVSKNANSHVRRCLSVFRTNPRAIEAVCAHPWAGGRFAFLLTKPSSGDPRLGRGAQKPGLPRADWRSRRASVPSNPPPATCRLAGRRCGSPPPAYATSCAAPAPRAAARSGSLAPPRSRAASGTRTGRRSRHPRQ